MIHQMAEWHYPQKINQIDNIDVLLFHINVGTQVTINYYAMYVNQYFEWCIIKKQNSQMSSNMTS